MTLADLLTTLAARGALRASRVKDMKTSLRYLARALGHATLEQAPVAEACRDPDSWLAALETHFQALEAVGRTINATTRRNTRNNCRVLFRQAEAHRLLAAPLPVQLLTKPRRKVFKRQQQATAPYQRTYRPQSGPRHYGLPRAQWPPDIQAGLARVPGALRAAPPGHDAQGLCAGPGALSRLPGACRRPSPHVGRPLCRGPTQGICPVARRTGGAANQRPWTARGDRHRRPGQSGGAWHARALADFRNTLTVPAPLHVKRSHWVPLATLEAVADACLTEGRAPYIDRGTTGSQGRTEPHSFKKV